MHSDQEYKLCDSDQEYKLCNQHSAGSLNRAL